MPVKTVAKGIHVVPVTNVNVIILEDEQGPVLVDTGMPGDSEKILVGLKELGYTAEDVHKIIVTHHHVDHSGSLAELKHLTGASAIMHPIDAIAVRQAESLRSIKRTSGLFAIAMSAIIRFTPSDIEAADIEDEVNDGDKLSLAGGMEVIHTPGHSAGHISLYLPRDGGILIVGDVAINVMGLRLPPIVEDLSTNLASLDRIARLPFQTAVFMHGDALIEYASEQFAAKWKAQSGVPIRA